MEAALRTFMSVVSLNETAVPGVITLPVMFS